MLDAKFEKMNFGRDDKLNFSKKKNRRKNRYAEYKNGFEKFGLRM